MNKSLILFAKLTFTLRYVAILATHVIAMLLPNTVLYSNVYKLNVSLITASFTAPKRASLTTRVSC